MANTESDYWRDDANRLNRLCAVAKLMNVVIPISTGEDEDDSIYVDGTTNAFCPTGKGGGIDATCSPKKSSELPTRKQPKECPPPCDRPSKPEERVPNAKPKVLPYQDPPPKLGKKGGGQITRPKGDDSQTKIGDLGESMATQLGFRSILPEGKRSFTAAEVKEKGSSVDLEWDHSGIGAELKLCNNTATELRLKAKKEEKDEKERYARDNDLTLHTLIGVRDVHKEEIHFYMSKQPGLIGAEVSEKHFDYLGVVRYGKGKKVSNG